MNIGLAVGIVGVGLCIGTVAGTVGIGGGVLVIPVLMIGFGFTQSRANGTSLAMLLPPVGILAVAAYARAGNVDWPIAGLLAVGFTAGAALGGTAVNRAWIDPLAVRVGFAAVLLYVAGRTLFRPAGQARAALETVALIVAGLAPFAVLRRLGRHLADAPGQWGDQYRDRWSRRRGRPAETDYEI